MKTTKTIGYAIACLHALAKRLGEFVQVSEIALTQNIPAAYCQKVLLLMSRAGLVESIKGRGFTLIRSFESISTLEVIRALNQGSDKKIAEEPEIPQGTNDFLTDQVNRLLAKLSVAEVAAQVR